MEQTKAGLKTLFDNLPKHNSDHSPISRHANVYTIDVDPKNQQALVISTLQVFKIVLDGGASELMAIGKYHDAVDVGNGMPKLLTRNVRLDTRMLGIGYHIPF